MTKTTTNTVETTWECVPDIFILLSMANDERKDKEFYFETRTQENAYKYKIAELGKKVSELNQKLKGK